MKEQANFRTSILMLLMLPTMALQKRAQMWSVFMSKTMVSDGNIQIGEQVER
jgi:hypothetical protein